MNTFTNNTMMYPRVGDTCYGDLLVSLKRCTNLKECQRIYKGIQCSGHMGVSADGSAICCFDREKLSRTYSKSVRADR